MVPPYWRATERASFESCPGVRSTMKVLRTGSVPSEVWQPIWTLVRGFSGRTMMLVVQLF